MRESARYHGRALVRRLLEANLADVPAIIGQIGVHRRWTDPLLWREHERAAEDSPARLHTALALLPIDGGLLDLVYDRLVQAAPGDFPILRDALLPYRREMSARLSDDAGSAGVDGRVLRTAGALARYEPDHPRWGSIRDNVTRVLTGVSPEALGVWKDALATRPRRAARPAGRDLPRPGGRRAPALAGHLDAGRLRGRRADRAGRPDQGCQPSPVRRPLPRSGQGSRGRDRRAGAGARRVDRAPMARPADGIATGRIEPRDAPGDRVGRRGRRGGVRILPVPAAPSSSPRSSRRWANADIAR